LTGAPPAGVEPPGAIPEVVSREVDDLRLHVVNTGWVRVKEAHRTLSAPVPLRLPSIVLDRRWTEFMPMLVGVIEHPEGVFLVDAGLAEETLDPAHFACDPGTSFVYGRLLDFRFSPGQRVDRRLAALGIDPARLRGVVLTHRHADHADAVAHLPRGVEVFVGAGDWPGHNGALPWGPGGAPPTRVADEGPGAAAFPHARPLTRDGRVAIIPLRGHSPGHLGVLVRGSSHDVVFAGDAAFSLEQVERRLLAGIVEAPADALRSLDLLATQLQRHPTQLLFAHDPVSLDRFARGLMTRPKIP
jgi:glyoxylase-like metal-dependent hydrolase (beta-lactamase superfamily II)